MSPKMSGTAPLVMIDDIAEFKGFGTALYEVGWLEILKSGCFFPNWEEWNEPMTQDESRKEYEATRKREQRARKRAEGARIALANTPVPNFPIAGNLGNLCPSDNPGTCPVSHH